MGNLNLGLQLGYWGGGPNPKMVEIVQSVFLFRAVNFFCEFFFANLRKLIIEYQPTREVSN